MCVRWPVREGMKTIRQIADEIGVSKQAVYKRYKGKLYTVCAPYAHTEQGVLYLSEQAETLIKQDFLRDGCPNGSHTDTHTERSIGAVPEQSQEAGVVAILQATIDTLQGQLSVKDKQIEELNAKPKAAGTGGVPGTRVGAGAQLLGSAPGWGQCGDGFSGSAPAREIPPPCRKGQGAVACAGGAAARAGAGTRSYLGRHGALIR